jgi:hypothetical protein
MSAALSAAKKRRAPSSLQPETPGRPVAGQPQNETQGLTLPQVITLIDKRLVQLELFANKAKNSIGENASSTGPAVPAVNKDEIIEAVLEEFNARFDIMAEEIANIKNIVLSLQSYTMDVNKMLLTQQGVIATDSTHDAVTFTISSGGETGDGEDSSA